MIKRSGFHILSRGSQRLQASFQRSYSTSTQPQPESTLNYYAKRNPRGVNIKQLMDHGKTLSKKSIMTTGKWLHEELPIRLARQVKAIDVLPFGLALMPSVRNIRSRYVASVNELHSFPEIKDWEQLLKFSNLIRDLFEKHSSTLISMAKGLLELKQELGIIGGADLSQSVDVSAQLDSFFTNRIGIRFLVAQHLSVTEQLEKPVRDYIGVICKNTSLSKIARDAAHDASYIFFLLLLFCYFQIFIFQLLNFHVQPQ
eukprot:TRINITY_DN185_c1_g1_i1.p1 TRINITY_DN185_c1_g1~~TRINITY_DN185_c1_g1_i1.p1  ORF type:complete len:257 (+),score=21.52 TRINITY_DN185_c1_g1_i1:49-819(+)